MGSTKLPTLISSAHGILLIENQEQFIPQKSIPNKKKKLQEHGFSLLLWWISEIHTKMMNLDYVSKLENMIH